METTSAVKFHGQLMKTQHMLLNGNSVNDSKGTLKQYPSQYAVYLNPDLADGIAIYISFMPCSIQVLFCFHNHTCNTGKIQKVFPAVYIL